ncbi:MAG: hypothetical protein WGN25_11340 [Candidatus Electrothrix sp. GW3-4]|uniref:hypothetical protein n=1 Tax=Candidatus Electrothrix sp. GW3-4 TaxID=3126740 RepID=UPI0030D11345
MNKNAQGGNRQGRERISRWTYFGHGKPGELMLQYNNNFGLNPGAESLTSADITSGAIAASAFAKNAIGISCGCNSAAKASTGESLRDVWKAYFDFEFYGVDGRTNYANPNNVQPSDNAKWVPNSPPNYSLHGVLEGG